MVQYDIDGLVQERCNSIANALELHVSCTNPLICPKHFEKKKVISWLYFHWSLTQGVQLTSQHWFRWHAVTWINTLRPRQNGRRLPDDIFKCIFLNEHVWISLKISLKFVPKVPINNIPALVLIMAWRRPGDKALSQIMMVRLPMHKCVTRPQWVNVDPIPWHMYFCCGRIDFQTSA